MEQFHLQPSLPGPEKEDLGAELSGLWSSVKGAAKATILTEETKGARGLLQCWLGCNPSTIDVAVEITNNYLSNWCSHDEILTYRLRTILVTFAFN